jgi:hypothetical protein
VATLTESIAIFTDESGVKLPNINRRKGILGRGFDIRDLTALKDALYKNGLGIPGQDLDREEEYKISLKEYLRPARLMFSGSFTEVRIFSDILKKIIPTEIFILSGRYGLLHEDTEILPYTTELRSTKELEELDKRTSFSKSMLSSAKDKRFVIITLPTQILQYLKQIGWFKKLDDEQNVIIVAASSIKSTILEDVNAKFLLKRGVARIGKENQNTILKIIESELQIPGGLSLERIQAL